MGSTGYSNADVDAMIVSLGQKQIYLLGTTLIAKIWANVQDAQMYLPIHQSGIKLGYEIKY